MINAKTCFAKNPLLAFVLWAMWTWTSVLAQDGGYTSEQLRGHFEKVANAYEMNLGGKELTLRKQPLMFWQNTVRNQEQGALYVWTDGERPQVLCSIFTFQNGGKVQCRHEAISISEQPFVSRLDGTKVWTPKKAGVKWLPFNGSASPAESEPRRMSQMRGIARSFIGTLSIPGSQSSTLSLIPQPLIRYQDPDSGVVDGAIFSLAVVTDPEILLLVEAKKAKEKTVWQYAVARAHYHKLTLSLANQMVWSAPMELALENTNAGELPHVNDPYFIFFPPKPLPAPEDL